MRETNHPESDDAITDAAAHWCMRLHEPDCTDAERDAFAQWLAADPRHAVEYQAMQEIWDVADHLPRPPKAQVLAMPTPRRAWRSYGVAAAVSLLAIPLAGYIGWNLGWVPNAYQRFEATGQRQQVTLPDGSQVELNLGTQLTYSNYKDQRRVVLNKGEAFFQVSHSLEHPFVVKAGEGQVRVTGTQFNVWKYQDQVQVTLLQGSVLVGSHQDTQGYRLDPGMQARYKAGDFEPRINQTDSDDVALAWRSGKLILDNLALADALPLINRYLDKPVLLANSAVGQIRLGGIYDTAQIQDLVASLPKVLPVRLTRNNDGNSVISSAPGTPPQG
ncbi:fec operon regulator FecR [compost metagenome]